MFCIVSFVENTIDDRTAGTVPFDGRYAFAGHDPSKVRAYIWQYSDNSMVFKFSFKESGYLFHLDSFLMLLRGCFYQAIPQWK